MAMLERVMPLEFDQINKNNNKILIMQSVSIKPKVILVNKYFSNSSYYIDSSEIPRTYKVNLLCEPTRIVY